MYDSGDILLYSLSAWGHATWSAFKRCFDEVQRKHVVASYRLEKTPGPYHRWRALRLMSSLGHVDVSFGAGGRRIAVVAAPPALAVLPSFGVRRAVLCGARSPNTTRDLRSAASLEGAAISVRSQVALSPYAPARVELGADGDERLHAIADRLGIPYLDQPPAWNLVQAAISLDEYCQGLSWFAEEDLNWYREDFNVCSLRFELPEEPSGRARLSRYRDPITTAWRYRLWNEGHFAEVEPDWGRYAVLSAHSKQVLRYDSAKRNVLVPSAAPLPTLLARALGLCSGYASRPKQRGARRSTELLTRYEAFETVPPSIFRAVARKVGHAVCEVRS